MPTTPGTQFGGATDPGSIHITEGLHVVPTIQVSEYYDSNVFFLPKSQLQGLNPEDLVTTVAPQVRGLYTDHNNLVKVNAVVGAVGSYYVNNTGLSYVGANAAAILDMSELLSRWRPGTKGTVSDTFFYSPEPPAFLVGGELGQQANPLVAGFQAFRANTTSNSIRTAFELPLNRTVKLSVGYTNSFIHFGESQVPQTPTQTPTLISQDSHNYTAGLLKEISLYDTVRAEFTGDEFNQGGLGSFSTRGGTLGWVHKFTPAITLNAAAGAQVLSGELNGSPFPSTIAPVGRLAIDWKDSTTSITLAYRSGIIPSFQFQSATLLSHTVSINMTQSTPIPDLAGLFQANYGIADEYGPSSGGAISWTTVGGMAGLRYRASQKLFLILTYHYLNVDNVFGGTRLAYDRHLAQLSLAQAFY